MSTAEAGSSRAADSPHRHDPVSVAEAASGSRLRAFLDVPARLAAASGTEDHRVPLLRSDLRALVRATAWFPEPVTALLAERGGEPVGRAICHRSPALDDRLAESTGRQVRAMCFGAFDAASPEVAAALLDEVEARALADGCTHVFGPVTPLPNVTGGLITSGFAAPGFFDSAWNPEWLPDALRAHGFRSWGEAATWEVDVAAIPRALTVPPTETECAAAGVRLAHPRRTAVGRLADRILPTLNASFAALPYYTEIPPEQIRAQVAGLGALMDPRLIVTADALGGDADAPPLCFALVVPDPVDVLRRTDGRLSLGAGIDLLRGHIPALRRGPRDAVLIIQGTAPAAQGRGLLSLVIRQVYAGLTAGGYHRLRVTFIAEDNPASSAVFAKAGGHRLHGLEFCLKEIA